MRISQVILSKRLGGAERHVADLANELADRHDVQAILRRPARRDAGSSHGGNIAPMLDSRVTVQEVGGLLRNRQIGEALRDFRPDIVHTHLGDAGKALRAIRPGVPLVATLHGEYKDKCYRAHDALICVADWQRRSIAACFSGQITTIPNFIADRTPPTACELEGQRRNLGIPEGSLVIGAVGRLSHEKGFDTLLRAFRHTRLNHARLILVGNGPQRTELEALASPEVIFTGWQENPWSFYHLFDVFVAASRYESFGIAVLEAMQAGVPVLATRAQGPGEILDGGTGILVDVDDVEAMADALRQMCESRDLRDRLAAAGRNRARDYSIGEVVPRIEAVYRKLA